MNDAALDLGSVHGDGAVVNLGGELGVVAEHRGDVVHVVLGLDEPFAGVECLSPGELGTVPLEGIGDPVEQRPTLGGRGGRPRPGVEGLSGCCDSRFGVCGRALIDGGDQ